MDRELEIALVARLRDGDASAFDVVHHQFNTPLFNFLARLTHRRDVAEDLLEETWLRFVSRARLLRSDTRLGAWLFTVARNLHVSYRRSRLVEDSHVAGLIGLWPCGLPQRSPFDMTAASEAERRIEEALAALPLSYREALLLVAIEGMTPTEASDVCGISPEAMRQRLKRARAQLTRHLGESEVPLVAMLKEVEV
ncbi:MAG: RNA polymerase sigma factor [Vicinamibacterales bacterium]